MKVRLIAVGSRPEPWVSAAWSQYCERLPRHLQPELVEIPLGRRPARSDPSVARDDEGVRILKRVGSDEHVIALDERGQGHDSVRFARELGRWEARHRAVVLVIGGPDGLSAAVRSRANQTWSLSPLTFPHGLVRIMVIEQLYRAFTIGQGHPYHRP